MNAGTGSSRRVHELDAVRGVAAIAVVLGHLAITLPAVDNASRSHGVTPLNVLLYSPLDAIINGGAAVIVFFVLSGYVLSLSYEHGRQTYLGFLVRRVARLWFPYIVAVAAGIALAAILGGTVVSTASDWFNSRWQEGVNTTPVIEHLTLVGHYRDNAQYVPVIWSLTDEMRISLVFPLLLLVLSQWGWKLTLAASAVLTVIAFQLVYEFSGDFRTLEFVVCFAAGAALAQGHETISRILSVLGSGQRAALLAVGLLLYTWSAWMPPSLLPGPAAKLATSEATLVLLETVAAAIFIVLARHPGRARKMLLSAVPQYFGRVSYSLYLLHTVVLLTLIHIVDPGNSGLILALLPFVFLLSILLADFSQRWVELPAQRLGRRIAYRVEHGIWPANPSPLAATPAAALVPDPTGEAGPPDKTETS